MSDNSKHAELIEHYNEADTCDKEIFAEERSNILLISGEHYNKSKHWQGIRSRTDIPHEQKIRLVQNHIQRIIKVYDANILSAAPGVKIVPANPQSIQDKKSAEMRQAVWAFAKKKYRFKSKIRDYVEDFNHLGEVAVKIFWDPSMGEISGYEPKLGEDGEPLFDEDGDPVADETKPVFSGDFVFERVFGFNLLRDPNAKDMNESPWLMIRKMVDIKTLKKRYANDETKLKWVTDEQDRTYKVFDGQKGSYSNSKGQVMMRECYYRPCEQYPQGYYYFFVDGGILEEGELPAGVFPIVFAPFEKIQTSPRGRSPVKHMRPYQAEINRAGSKIAEHQITLGDDKIVYTSGSKIEQGGSLPGVRGVKVAGEKATILPGRDGSQYLAYMQDKITELYQVMGVDELIADKPSGQIDPYALVMRSAAQKKVFSANVERFEGFLIDFCETFLKLAQYHYPDDMVIEMVGRHEAVNMAEFKNAQPLGYQITLESVSEDIETRLGKQIVLSQALQYGGDKLTPELYAKIIKNMPFAQVEDAFSDFTQNERVADNLILKLDRGEEPSIHLYDDHEYMIKRLLSRMREPDFDILPEFIKANYEAQVDLHENAASEMAARIMAAKSEFIPTSGALVACDIYVPDPNSESGAQKRARIPYDALSWLLKRMELQGTSMEKLDQLHPESGTRIVEKAKQFSPPGQDLIQPPAAVNPASPAGGSGVV